MTSPTASLARYISETKFSDLPGPVVRKAKRCILDSIGCAIGGYASLQGHALADLMVGLGGKPDATILGSGLRVSMPNAALVNTYMANILDYDDTYHGHPACTVVPPALAGGEVMGASGKDLIASVVVGYEIHSRVAASLRRAPNKIDKVSGPSNQTFGSVSSAAKILMLEFDQILDALGIAGSTAPVPSNSKTGGAECTPPTMKVGFYACSWVGAMSALLAKSGVTGPHNILDGETGFWRMVSADRCDFGRMTSGLGKRYEILDVAFKPYSCCRWFHSSIDAVLGVIAENKISVKDIDQIHIETLGGKRNLGYMKNPKPENIVAAEFSLPYSVAVALSGIEPGPDWYSKSAMTDESILRLAGKISCRFKQKSELGRKKDIHGWPASVEIKVGDAKYHKLVQYPKGAPRNKMTEEELDRKFLRLAGYVLDQDQAKRVKEVVSHLEELDSFTDLMSMFQAKV
jgi:2-methylcitrate dehydratase PrpD